ncbi:MAG: RNA 2',3'-cyclic phosphodiesterase [Bauldia sp.]
MPRLFTGIEIPAAIAEMMTHLRGGLPRAHWTETDNYHLTLRFIGDIDMIKAEAVAEGLSRVRRRRFELSLVGVAALGTRNPHVIAALAGPAPPLTELQAEHERICQRLGLPPEGRKYTPHVSLARLRNVSQHAIAEYLGLRGAFRAGPFMVDRFVLFSARNATGGGPYVVEETYPLYREPAPSGVSLPWPTG